MPASGALARVAGRSRSTSACWPLGASRHQTAARQRCASTTSA